MAAPAWRRFLDNISLYRVWAFTNHPKYQFFNSGAFRTKKGKPEPAWSDYCSIEDGCEVNSTVVLCWNSLQPCCSNTNIMINLEDSIVHSKQQLPAYFSIRDAGRLFLVEIRISITICTKRPRDQYIHSSCFLNKTKSSQNLRGRCVALLWKFKPKKKIKLKTMLPTSCTLSNNK